MRIVDVRERTVSIASPIANAFIDFSKMTCSIVAVVTDVVRDGAPVVGYGFNSNGRYGQGALIRERLLPRLAEANPADLLDDAGANLDPFRIWATLMRNEKPGGHGERSVAVGTLDMAVWDAVSKIAEKPLYRLLAERFGDGAPDDKVWVYAAGGYYYPGKGLSALQDEMRGYLDRGYTTVKMKIGGAPLAEDLKRIEAVLAVVGTGQKLAVDANGRFDLDMALAYATALEPYGLFWYEEAGDPLDFALQAELSARYGGATATGENLFSHQDARNLLRYGGMDPSRDWLQFDCAFSYGPLNICARSTFSSRTAGRTAESCRTAAIRCRSTSQRGWASAATNPIQTCSALSEALRTTRTSSTAMSACPTGRALASRPRATCSPCSAKSSMLDRQMSSDMKVRPIAGHRRPPRNEADGHP